MRSNGWSSPAFSGSDGMSPVRVALAAVALVLALGCAAAAAGAGGAPRLALSWTAPPRFGVDANRDGLVDYPTTAAAVSPARWPVDVRVRAGGGCPAARASFRVDGATAPARRTGRCVYRLQVRGLGRHRLAARVGAASGTTTATLRDLLVFGLGDSIASGEGSPDVPGTQPRWEDARCDRSAKSFEAQSALALERGDAHTTVTFVHLACAGASIDKGLLGSYGGINDPGGAPLPPQVEQMRTLAGSRPIDAVIISAGINDIGFSAIVRFCLAQAACMNAPYPDPSSTVTLNTFVAARIAALPTRYAALQTALGQAGVPAARVVVTEYPDPTRDASGSTYCNPLLTVPGYGTVDAAEAAWASQSFLAPLNATVAQAAAQAGWRLAGGVASAFAPHGACSSAPWVVGLLESLRNQGSINGTLHPNPAGQRAITGLVQPVLVASLR